jgi:RNA polymerase sigma-70 factor (ECF subfamily)
MLDMSPLARIRPATGIVAGKSSMADLLQRIAEKGDNQAFIELFQAYAPRVKAYMMRQGADAQTAEELAQETLLTVWRKAALYSQEKGSATTWIFTIARNLRIDRLRKE